MHWLRAKSRGAYREMIDVEEIAKEIGERLRALPAIKTEAIRAIRHEFSKRLAKAPPQAVIRLALRLLDFSGIEYRIVAYELICHHRAALRGLGEMELQLLGQGIDGWGATDMFACYLAGPAWREKQISDKLIHRWARSLDRWWRRAALASTVPLNNKARGGKGNAARTLAVCRMLVSDRDDMVVKALSWALRELAKRDPRAVQEFLAEHETVLAARVIREVRHKLTTGLKNPCTKHKRRLTD